MKASIWKLNKARKINCGILLLINDVPRLSRWVLDKIIEYGKFRWIAPQKDEIILSFDPVLTKFVHYLSKSNHYCPKNSFENKISVMKNNYWMN